ncbi:hypothetical protein [Staphylococcus haemolyticus]|nr:hypothetical protein [Staphylococcus haemolyticus]
MGEVNWGKRGGIYIKKGLREWYGGVNKGKNIEWEKGMVLGSVWE